MIWYPYIKDWTVWSCLHYSENSNYR